MKVGVPGEFHEDRWQRTAEDSERRVFPRTWESGETHRIQVIAWLSGLLTGLRHGDPAHRYPRAISVWQTGTEPMPNRSINGAMGTLRHGDPAHRYSRGIPSWRRGHLSALRHSHPAHRYLSGIPAWRRGSSGRSSARHPCPQVSQWHPRVAKMPDPGLKLGTDIRD